MGQKDEDDVLGFGYCDEQEFYAYIALLVASTK